jgi:long-chain acyl-CoA synthetase
MPQTPIADEAQGMPMLYSSGTTGRPKGIRHIRTEGGPPPPNPMLYALAPYTLSPEMTYLSPAPLYHGAPLGGCMSAMRAGATVVVMEKFDPEAYLQAVQRYQVTVSQLVPTMFVRMLKLPDDVRANYDLSSLKVAFHAAAPCPVLIKQAMIEWWGPIINEYYAGTESVGLTAITSEEWLRKPGSVGRAKVGELKICDEDGEPVGPNIEGGVYYANGPRFQYHNAPEKTAGAYNKYGWGTLGDVGYVDEDGYLFLTDRKAFMIIAGGVNIYPQEIENLLVTHPKVADAAVFGIPHPEMGEDVKAVIQPLDWAEAGPELEAELAAFCRANLSHVKCPRSIDFMQELPRHANGKLYKRTLRDPYWANHKSKIM